MSSPQSVARVIHILEALCASSEPLSLADLSRSLETPKSSMAALLRGLVEADFVSVSDGVYQLAPGAFGLGSALLAARRRIQSSDLIRAGMRKLAERSGETVLLAVRDTSGTTLTYVDMIESHNAVRFSVALGDRRPLYCTAAGRVLLAAGTQADQRRYLKQLKPSRLTAATETDKRKLHEAIEAARQSGVAQTNSQAADAAAGTAAVLRNDAGEVLGALVLAAPTSRFQGRASALARLVLAAAADISRSLGYRP
ncbi:MAG: IclR family transcriptional regulator [Myxococcales bacterium]|nr:IclR family transcriptional regulator [Myxococcales bacterium]MDD9967660.1 IclR family transcriptional regulator [Myxococcales bacterium]